MPRRTGDSFGDDIDRRRLIRAQDDETAKRGLANRASAAATRFGSRPESPIGLTLTQQVGTVYLEWDAIVVYDLDYYEVDISEKAGFQDKTTFKTRETTWTFDKGVAGTTYYGRVRGVNSSGIASAYSGTVSSVPGQVSSGGIATGAASLENVQFRTDLFEFTPGGASWDEVLVTNPLTLTASDTVMFTVAVVLDPSGAVGNLDLRIQGRPDASTTYSTLTTFRLTIKTSDDGALTGLFPFLPGIAGDWTFKLAFQQADAGGSPVKALSQIFRVQVLR